MARRSNIVLEELKDIYGLEWTISLIYIDTDEQKETWFLKLNSNGRIPILIDNTSEPPFPVFESSAELLYLLDMVDKDHHFGFSDPKEQSQLIQWLIIWHASGQPNQGQLNHFGRFAPIQIPCMWTFPMTVHYHGYDRAYMRLIIQFLDAVEKIKTETLRVYNVLELYLSGALNGQPRAYLAGNGLGKFSVADVNAYPWRSGRKRSTISVEKMAQYAHLKEWIERIGSRLAVQRRMSDVYNEEGHPELLVNPVHK